MLPSSTKPLAPVNAASTLACGRQPNTTSPLSPFDVDDDNPPTDPPPPSPLPVQAAAPSPCETTRSALKTPPSYAANQKRTTTAQDAKLCKTCKSGSSRRNLAVCIDGTSNQFSRKNTNVVELYRRLLKDDTQLTLYNSGIGTYARPSWKSLDYYMQVIANKMDLAFALRFEKIIIGAYAWLVDNYQEGDRIFLFGFSRGAYQVRALAAMIDTVGLLHKGNDDQIPFAYELYAASGDGRSTFADHSLLSRSLGSLVSRAQFVREQISWRPEKSLKLLAKSRIDKPRTIPRPKPRPTRKNSDRDAYTLQGRFKDTFSRKVKVHFLGAWDTVSSVGLVRDKTLPYTTQGMASVCYFRHALALHEYRVKFLPEYANGGDGPDEDRTAAVNGQPPHTKEVWFTGSHSDMGGGSSANTTLDKFGPSLRWMSREAMVAGLRFADTPCEWAAGQVSCSMSPIWSLVECLPIKRLSYEGEHSLSWRPHLFADRRIQPGQLVHQTVYEECDTVGLPDFAGMEQDEYTITKTLVITSPEEAWKNVTVLNFAEDIPRLEALFSSEAGRQSLGDFAGNIYRSIDEMALFCHRHQETDLDRSSKLMGELCLRRDRIAYRTCNIDQHMTRLSKVLGTSSEDTYCSYPFALRGHTKAVSCVAFLSQRLVVSGSWDETLRIWDIETGETVGGPLARHCDAVRCLAVSADGKLVASGSNDGIIYTWKVKLGSESGTPQVVGTGPFLRADDMYRVPSVAFTPDGAQIIAASGDRALHVWDATTGQPVVDALHGHGDRVWCVAVAHWQDGARIASGSDEGIVRLWDARTMRPLGAPLTGHTSAVLSVAFSPSPESTSLASGSADGTIRIWDSADSALKHTVTLVGHTAAVTSVAFSPSGRHIASASADETVRIWDALTGGAVGVLRGHVGRVNAVAFSPDGTRVVSGADDGTVRVWDRIPMMNLSQG